MTNITNIKPLSLFDESKQAKEGQANFRVNASYSWSWLIEHTKEVNDLIVELDNRANEIINEVNAHVQEHLANNPVNRVTLELDKIDNTCDLEKPVSIATQEELDKKIDKQNVEDSFTCNDSSKVLSARCGKELKELKELIDTIDTNIKIGIGSYALVTVNPIAVWVPKKGLTPAHYKYTNVTKTNENVAGSSLVEVSFSNTAQSLEYKSYDNYSKQTFSTNSTNFIPTGRSLQGTWALQGTAQGRGDGYTCCLAIRVA